MALDLSEDGRRALREAENFCWRTRVGIVAAEHLLSGALVAAAATGTTDLPDEATLEEALIAVHGAGESELTQNVMFGSSAREALNSAAKDAGERGLAVLDAATLAASVIQSGELKPMFYSCLGVTKDELLSKLT